MKGVVTIRGLEPETVIGCYDWSALLSSDLSLILL